MADNKKKQNTPQENAGEKILRTLHVIGSWAYELRSILLSVPVVIGAIWLAVYNSANLPEIVGLDLQASGEYAILVDRSIAVLGPLAVTAVCLLMVFISRRVVYPWLISVFSLILPVLLLLSNTLLG